MTKPDALEFIVKQGIIAMSNMNEKYNLHASKYSAGGVSKLLWYVGLSIDKFADYVKKYCESKGKEDGGKYIFFTNEEQEAENAIRSIHVEGSEVVNYVAKMIFDDDILPFTNSRFKYNNRHMFLFNQQIDDRMYHNVNQNDPIGLHVFTAYSGKEDEYTLGTMSMTEKRVIVRLSQKEGFVLIRQNESKMLPGISLVRQ